MAVVYLGGVTGRWWPSADSALYLSLGRSLAAGEGYRFNGTLCTSVTPGLPLILAGLTALFGPGFWAPNLLMAISALAALGLIYLVVSMLEHPRGGLASAQSPGVSIVAVCVAAGTALTYAFYFNAHRILTDMPFTALFWGMLYAALRYQRGGSVGWVVLAGLLAASGLTVRAPGLLVVAPAALGLLLDPTAGAAGEGMRRRRVSAAAALSGVGVLAAAFFLLARAEAGHSPAYAELLFRWLGRDAGTRLEDFGAGIAKLPETISQIFTSQRGVGFDQVGLIVLGLILIGAVSLWRRGSRLAATLVVLCPLLLIVLASSRSLRVRYLLPIQAMLVYADIEGFRWCLQALHRWKLKRARFDPLRASAITIAVLIGLCNAPRMGKHAFYYPFLAHTGRFYQVIREGRYDEALTLSEIIRRNCSPGRRVVMTGEDRPIFVLLAGRPIAPLDEIGRRNGQQAQRLLESVAAEEDLEFLILDMDGASPRFRQRLLAGMAGLRELKSLHRGERYMGYLRVRPQAASGPSSRRGGSTQPGSAI